MLEDNDDFLSSLALDSAEVTAAITAALATYYTSAQTDTAISAAIAAADNAYVKCIRLAISYTPATQTSTVTIPANARIVRTTLIIGTAMNNTPTIKAGFAESLEALFATTNNDPTVAGQTTFSYDKAWHTAARAVVTTIGGTPNQGNAVLLIEYCETPLGP